MASLAVVVHNEPAMSTAPQIDSHPVHADGLATPGSSAPVGLRRTLERRHMQMIALGGVIGAGLFVGSGVVVKAAGPGAVLSFALTARSWCW